MLRSSVHDPARAGQILHLRLRKHCPAWDACNDVDWRVRPPRSRDRRVSKMSEPIVKRRPMIDLEEFERRLRKPLAANQGDDDPLAELARFVGEQEDPY